VLAMRPELRHADGKGLIGQVRRLDCYVHAFFVQAIESKQVLTEKQPKLFSGGGWNRLFAVSMANWAAVAQGRYAQVEAWPQPLSRPSRRFRVLVQDSHNLFDGHRIVPCAPAIVVRNIATVE